MSSFLGLQFYRSTLYLGILETNSIKQVEMTEKKILKYFRRNRKPLETKLYSRDLNEEINTWAVSFVRYSGQFLKWTREELKQMDQRTRKLMTMHKFLHPINDVNRYVSRKEGGKRLTGMEGSVGTSKQRFKDYIEKRGGSLITANRSNTDDTGIKRTEITR